MQGIFIQYICLILIILGLVMIADKLRLAYPIVLVLGGLALSFITPFSTITINPELVFLIFLPPLLYEAAWQVSWKEFWKWRGLIIGFAFPIVILTSCVIAVVSGGLLLAKLIKRLSIHLPGSAGATTKSLEQNESSCRV
jgi:CPA1 family monovalent cation:H+ antiporter